MCSSWRKTLKIDFGKIYPHFHFPFYPRFTHSTPVDPIKPLPTPWLFGTQEYVQKCAEFCVLQIGPHAGKTLKGNPCSELNSCINEQLQKEWSLKQHYFQNLFRAVWRIQKTLFLVSNSSCKTPTVISQLWYFSCFLFSYCQRQSFGHFWLVLIDLQFSQAGTSSMHKTSVSLD